MFYINIKLFHYNVSSNSRGVNFTLSGGTLTVNGNASTATVNNAYLGQLQRAGLIVSGINPRRNLVEIVELKGHPWFLGTQAHPEFQSKPNKAHPLFAAFIAAALKNKKGSTRPKAGAKAKRPPAKKK